MSYTVKPSNVEGVMRVPGSKSVTHRAMMLAAQSSVPCRIHGALRGGDTNATLEALRTFGADVMEGDPLTFAPAKLHAADVDLVNAGTGLRLLTALAARMEGKSRFDGDASLRQRPNAPLIDALRTGGAIISASQRIPYTVTGPIRARDYYLPNSVSSQYASAMLLNLPMLEGESTLTLEKPISSAPYLEITLRTAYAFGLKIDREDNVFTIPGGQTPHADHFMVEGDWSAAAFPLVAGAIAGRVTAFGVAKDTTQGDCRVAEIIADFGAKVTHTEHGCTAEQAPLTSPGEIDVSQIPDTFPALCVLAACAKGKTTFVGGQSLRDKESDRITAMALGLSRLGIRCNQQPDGLVVHGGKITGGQVHAHDDHRVHMALCIAGLVADGPVIVDGADTTQISYPEFHGQLERVMK